MCRRAAATDDRHHGRALGRMGAVPAHGKPVFNYNMLILAQYRWEGPDALTPGKHTIVFDYTYDGPAPPREAAAC